MEPKWPLSWGSTTKIEDKQVPGIWSEVPTPAKVKREDFFTGDPPKRRSFSLFDGILVIFDGILEDSLDPLLTKGATIDG